MTNKIAGWLILHTEGQDEATFQLKEGENLIGRMTQKNRPHIAIDDKYVSRHHAVVYVKQNEKYEYEYLIADNAKALGKPSTNGTFINGNTNRITEKSVKLFDADTIQVGLTKIVLKTAHVAIDVENAVKLVGKSEYKKTVDVKSNTGTLKRVVRK